MDRKTRHTAAWAGVCVLAVLTAVALVPSLWYVNAELGNTGDWQTNHADHVAAEHAVLLALAFVAGGALAGLGLRRLSGRTVSAAGQALALTTGALLGALALDITAFLWIVHNGTLFANIGGGAF